MTSLSSLLVGPLAWPRNFPESGTLNLVISRLVLFFAADPLVATSDVDLAPFSDCSLFNGCPELQSKGQQIQISTLKTSQQVSVSILAVKLAPFSRAPNKWHNLAIISFLPNQQNPLVVGKSYITLTIEIEDAVRVLNCYL